MLKIIAFTACF